MKLSDKILYLRKKMGITQEELAELCSVSRQSITKWESDIALPEAGKILLLSKIFKVSTDVLLRDELLVDAVRDVHCCGQSVVKAEKDSIYEGTLVKESIDDENILDYLDINKVELWRTNNTPKYWTMLFFTSKCSNLPDLMTKVMKCDEGTGVNWFVDFKQGNSKYIVFRDTILKYTIGNSIEKEAVCSRCRELGIPDEQMNWSE